jgi:hypothetical protein
MTTIKAVRATITLGDIELDVFQLPDGGYYFTQSVLKTIHITLSNTSGKKYVKPILEANSALLQTAQLEGNPVKLKLIPMSLFGEIVGIYAKLGNEYCIAILVACFEEALERRADAAFNVIRTEEERNQKFTIRRDGIISRYFWTDVIDEYLRTHEVSDTYKRFIYNHVSDAVNKAVLGMTAKQFRDSLGLPNHVSTRDYCTTEQLKQIDTIEKASGMRVKRDDMCPKQAIKDVISLIC